MIWVDEMAEKAENKDISCFCCVFLRFKNLFFVYKLNLAEVAADDWPVWRNNWHFVCFLILMSGLRFLEDTLYQQLVSHHLHQLSLLWHFMFPICNKKLATPPSPSANNFPLENVQIKSSRRRGAVSTLHLSLSKDTFFCLLSPSSPSLSFWRNCWQAWQTR